MQATTPEVKVEQVIRNEYGVYMTAGCGKVRATVGVTVHYTQVVCHNVANRVWRGSGRHFQTTAEALAGYKSPEMKAIIAAADKLNS